MRNIGPNRNRKSKRCNPKVKYRTTSHRFCHTGGPHGDARHRHNEMHYWPFRHEDCKFREHMEQRCRQLALQCGVFIFNPYETSPMKVYFRQTKDILNDLMQRGFRRSAFTLKGAVDNPVKYLLIYERLYVNCNTFKIKIQDCPPVKVFRPR